MIAQIKSFLSNRDYFEVIGNEEKGTIIIKTIWNDVSLDMLFNLEDNKLWHKSSLTCVNDSICVNDLWYALYENAMNHYEIVMNRLQKVTNVN